jgi:hypothetical protein
MISSHMFVVYDDFSDGHDEVVVTGVDYIGRRSNCGNYMLEKEYSLTLPTRTVTLGHQPHRQ